jgi:hypothetical protein
LFRVVEIQFLRIADEYLPDSTESLPYNLRQSFSRFCILQGVCLLLPTFPEHRCEAGRKGRGRVTRLAADAIPVCSQFSTARCDGNKLSRERR